MFSAQVVKAQNWMAAAEERSNERGALLAEYGMILMFVVFVAVLTISIFGISLGELYTDNTNKFTLALETPPKN